MSTVLDPQTALQRRVMIAILSVTALGATLATVLHRLQPTPQLVDLIAAPLLALTALGLVIRLSKQPDSLQQVTHLAILGAISFLVAPSWLFTLAAFTATSPSLINSLPPLTSALFLLTMVMLIALRPQQLIRITLLTWFAIAAPILTYLILHPTELTAPRGLDLVISLGPAMGVQIILILFYNRLQNMVDRLYTERLQYYAQMIERQTIRQQAMEQAFTQIHNGPLQTLALLRRDVQREQIPSQELLHQLLHRLDDLNAEIRAVGHSLTEVGEATPASRVHSTGAIASLELANSQHILRLGEGTCIDLHHPLHHLFYEVYLLTLKRNLPYFQTIRVKVRDFAPLPQANLTWEQKRNACLWLEESLCNVGKHAQGTTRMVVTGQINADHYVLQVQDNGFGLQPGQAQEGTHLCNILAERLGGTFRRESRPKGGVLCELSWPV